MERLKAAAEAEEQGDDTAMASVGSTQKEIFIKAPRETVFSFLTDPSRMAQWMGVRHVLIEGKLVVKDRRVLSFDLVAAQERVNQLAAQLRAG